jgi:hypothetical protein
METVMAGYRCQRWKMIPDMKNKMGHVHFWPTGKKQNNFHDQHNRQGKIVTSERRKNMKMSLMSSPVYCLRAFPCQNV